MKKLIFLTVLTLFSFMISCQKDEIKEGVENTQEVPSYDDTNSQLVEWNSFPEELKNAIPIENATENSSKAYSYPVGPFGGGGGGAFSVNPPSGTRIHAIAMRTGSRVDKLVVYYISPSGTIYTGMSRGGNGGSFYLHFFDNTEYIRRIAGRSGSRLDRLTIYTNKKTFTHGGNGGSYFNAAIPPSGFQILGFFGRSGSEIDRIGFYVHTL
ncbi:jacalin-like lectin [Aquimarina sp. Aq78]|uniref:jacalin-like lectin n=1 Tax=Aquimarina sp. Aq78 TaxID=1191889 RepID=UPI0018FF0920|nr:jacalin-like lectin [Aquimarina sp. Aq78]